MSTVHRYAVRTAWSGSTGVGYDRYSRAHEASAEPVGGASIATLSADPAFKGDPAHLNPEQLLVLAASSCQLLSFLAVAARGRVDVVAYVDEATAEMPEEPPPARIARIGLHPRITVALPQDDPARDDASDDRQRLTKKLDRFVDIAHRECFIANSLTSEIAISPSYVFTRAQEARD